VSGPEVNDITVLVASVAFVSLKVESDHEVAISWF
jgi:hypothetical protein